MPYRLWAIFGASNVQICSKRKNKIKRKQKGDGQPGNITLVYSDANLMLFN